MCTCFCTSYSHPRLWTRIAVGTSQKRFLRGPHDVYCDSVRRNPHEAKENIHLSPNVDLAYIFHLFQFSRYIREPFEKSRYGSSSKKEIGSTNSASNLLGHDNRGSRTHSVYGVTVTVLTVTVVLLMLGSM